MEIIELLKVIIVSALEGITEWLPVSSTGHMLLFDHFAKLSFSKDFKDLFMVVIQLGAIMAIVFIYWSRLNPLDRHKNSREKHETIELWKKIIIGAIPAGVVGLLFNNFIEKHFENMWVIASMLAIYGALFIVIERYRTIHRISPRVEKFEDMTYKDAAKIGAYQMLALIPGTSRSGSTIVGGLLTGVSRKIAVEFSFFMGIPIMLGSSALKIVKYGFKYSSSEIMYLTVALVATFIISMIVVRFLIDYLKKHDFQLFGWYRIILALVMICCFMIK
ncbi:MAG: undecaprenyl-diphosphate phosphatase [Candidatus Nanogingivalaceae bacterium]|jgi:undecaprenyl-diphosphatase uppP|nr:undecaprenyl-diphosphate phosphatase [Candidatus Nanogingivalaceae bacterium]